MLPQTPKAPTTLRQAFALADIVFCNARDERLQSLAANDYTDEAAKTKQLQVVGTIVAARWALETLVPAVDELRHLCGRTKPTPATPQTVLEYLALVVPELSVVAREGVALLPELAAETAQRRADVSLTNDVAARTSRYSPRTLRHYTPVETAKQVATARAHAHDATALLDRLPATLARIKQAAEAGETLTPAAAWLK